MVWSCFKVFWFSKDNPTGHSERKKEKRQTKKKRWGNNIKEWTGMDFASSTSENRTRRKKIVANSSALPRRPSKVMGEIRTESVCLSILRL